MVSSIQCIEHHSNNVEKSRRVPGQIVLAWTGKWWGKCPVTGVWERKCRTDSSFRWRLVRPCASPDRLRPGACTLRYRAWDGSWSGRRRCTPSGFRAEWWTWHSQAVPPSTKTLNAERAAGHWPDLPAAGTSVFYFIFGHIGQPTPKICNCIIKLYVYRIKAR